MIMKYIIYVLLCIGLLSSCNTEKQRQEDQRLQLEMAINNAEKSEIKVDSILLGFKFGMSEDETRDHIFRLIDEKKIYINDNSFYYNFHTSLGAIKSRIKTNFHDNKLYQVILIFERMGDIDVPTYFVVEADKAFKEKAKAEGFEYFLTYDIMDNRQTNYIKDNLIVELSSTINGTMSYTNAPIIKLVDADNKNREKETAVDL